MPRFLFFIVIHPVCRYSNIDQLEVKLIFIFRPFSCRP